MKAGMKGSVAVISSKKCLMGEEEFLKRQVSELSTGRPRKISLFCLVSIKKESQFRSQSTYQHSARGRNAVHVCSCFF